MFGQSNSGNRFGAFGSQNTSSTNQNQGGSLFGSSTNTSPFGANNANNTSGGFGQSGFGMNKPAAPTQPGGGLFGSQSSSTPTTSSFGGGFGANRPAFGSSTTPNQTSAFGTNTSTSNAGGTNLFGSNSNQTGTSTFGSFNNNSTGSTFGQNNGTSSGNLFGSKPASTSPFGSSLGGTQSNTGSAFGRPAGSSLFGGANSSTPSTTANQSNQGTAAVPFDPFKEVIKESSGTTTNVYQSISCMPQYQNFSFEELREQDYLQGRKYGTGSTGTSTTAGTTFGSGSTFGGQSQPSSGGLFGSNTSGGFGNNSSTANPFGGGSSSQSGSLFGQKPASSTTSGFNQSGSGGSGLFGGSTSFGSNTGGGSAFGQNSNTNTNQPSGGGLFGGSSSTFGQPSQQQNKSPFSFGGTGTTTTTQPTGFGASSTNSSTTPFGQSNTTTPGFGANTSGGFGATSNTGNTGGSLFSGFGSNNTNNSQTKPTFGGFGAPQNTSTPSFGSAGQQQQQQQQQKPAFSFGGASSTTPSTSLFGGGNTNQQSTGFGAGTTLGAGASQPATGQASNTPFSFGSGQSGGAGATSTPLFGGANNNANQPSGSLFGAKPAASTSSGGLFGTPAQSGNTGTGLFGGSGGATQQGSSLFNQSFSGGLQGKPGNQPAPTQLQASIDSNPFGANPLFSSTSQQPTNVSVTSAPLATPISQKTQKKKPAIISSYRLSPRPLSAPRGRLVRSPLPSSPRGPISGPIKNSQLFDYATDEAILSSDAFNTRHDMRRLVIDRKSSTDSHLLSGGADLSSSSSFLGGGRDHEKSVMFDTDVNQTPTLSREKASASSSVDQSLNRSAGPVPAVSTAKTSAETADNSENLHANKDEYEDGYWTIPSASELRDMSLQQLEHVQDYKVGRKGFGQVSFNAPVDLSGFASPDLVPGQVVVLLRKICIVYPDDANKPPVGKGLNVPATIILDGCFPLTKDTREPIRDASHPKVGKHVTRLKRMKGTEFVTYVPESGTWVFKVKHFSRWGLDDSEDEDDEDNYPADTHQSQFANNSALQTNTAPNDLFMNNRRPYGQQKGEVTSSMEESQSIDEGMTDMSEDSISAESMMAPSIESDNYSLIIADNWEDQLDIAADVNSYLDDSRVLSSGDVGKEGEPDLNNLLFGVAKVNEKDHSKRRKDLMNGQTPLDYFGLPRKVGAIWAPGNVLVTFGASRAKSSLSDASSKELLAAHSSDVSILESTFLFPSSAKHYNFVKTVLDTIISGQEEGNMGKKTNLLQRLGFQGLLENLQHGGNQPLPDAAIWSLASALFDKVDDEDVEIETRKDLLGTWLIRSSEFAAPYSDKCSIFNRLCRHELHEASEVAFRQNNIHLSAILPLAGGDVHVRADSARQIQYWNECGFINKIPAEILACYQLLAGDIDAVIDQGMIKALGADSLLTWKTLLGLDLWYGIYPEDPLAVALDKYLNRKRRWVRTEDGDPTLIALSMELLKLHANISPDVVKLLHCLSVTENGMFDASLPWIYLQILGLDNHSYNSDKLTEGFVFQLEACGLKSEALIITSFISDENERNRLATGLISRSWKDIQPRQLAIMNLPDEKLCEAKALELRYEKKWEQEAEALIHGGQFIEAHKTIRFKVAPECIISGHVEILENLLDRIKDVESIETWADGGQALCDYLTLLGEEEGDNEEQGSSSNSDHLVVVVKRLFSALERAKPQDSKSAACYSIMASTAARFAFDSCPTSIENTSSLLRNRVSAGNTLSLIQHVAQLDLVQNS